MSAPASGTVLGGREPTTARRSCVGSGVVQVRVREAVQDSAGSAPAGQVRIAWATFAYRVREGDQVILVGIGG